MASLPLRKALLLRGSSLLIVLILMNGFNSIFFQSANGLAFERQDSTNQKKDKEESVEEKTSSDEPLGKVLAIWRSNNHSYEGLGFQVHLLIKSLHNTKRLPTILVEFNEKAHRDVVGLLRHQKFPYIFWDDSIDNVLCDLNPMHCVRVRVPYSSSDENSLLTLTFSVSGYKVTKHAKSKWVVHDGDKIRIPVINFSKDYRIANFPIYENENIANIHDALAMGCSAISSVEYNYISTLGVTPKGAKNDIRCLEAVTNFNSPLWFNEVLEYKNPDYPAQSDEQLGKVMNKVREIAAINPTSPHEENKLKLAWKTISQLSHEWGPRDVFYGEERIVRLPVLTFEAILDLSKNLYANLSSKDIKFRIAPKILYDLSEDTFRNLLGPALSFKGKAPTPSSPAVFQETGGADGSEAKVDNSLNVRKDGLFEAMQMYVFKAINHPFSYGEDVPLFGRQPHPIGLVDSGFDPNHCEFTNEICSEGTDSGPESKLYHGHKVASVIAAGSGDGGMVGIDPYGRIREATVNLDESSSNLSEKAKNAIRNVASSFALIEDGVVIPPTVWNISGHWPLDDADSLEVYIKELWDGSHGGIVRDVFVVAAGNVDIQKHEKIVRREAGDSCNKYPACLTQHLPNVIGVLGVSYDEGNGKFKLWHNTKMGTYAHPKIDVAAIADKVVVIKEDGDKKLVSYGYYQGTSFATPQVTGTVALMKAINGGLGPKEIKNRIKACAHFVPEISDFVASGVLDVTCSIDMHHDRIIVSDTRIPNEKTKAEQFYIRQVLQENTTGLADFHISMRRGREFKGEVIQPKNLLRLLKRSDLENSREDRYFVLWKSEDGEFHREAFGRLESRSIILDVERVRDKKVMCIKLEDVEDLIPALRMERKFSNEESEKSICRNHN